MHSRGEESNVANLGSVVTAIEPTEGMIEPFSAPMLPGMSALEISARRRASDRLAISLFSGAGGLDLGLEDAGWDVLAQVEMDRGCAGTLELGNANRRTPVAVLPHPIEEVPPGQMRAQLGLRRGQLALLAGGPPCQPFTTSGLRRALTDRRASSAFPAYLDYVREFAPRALLIENVDGMLSAALRHRPLVERGNDHRALDVDERKGSFLHWLVHELADLGYSVSWGVIEAADHGVPQLRQRAILMGVIGDEPCFLPDPIRGQPGQAPFLTLRDGLRDVTEIGPVQPLSARKRAVYALVRPGGNWRELPDELRRETMGAAYKAEGGKSGWWRRLSWDLPAPTILGMPDHSSTALVHPDVVRCLSVNECAALQTFPVGTRFAGGSRSQYQQIGNAVPPRLASRLGAHLSRFLDGERTGTPPTPPWRRLSANRRIGTHGWAVPAAAGIAVTINGAVRPDHVWHFVQDLPHGVEQGHRSGGGTTAQRDRR
jgi:DNA (cytosine-5)-methyltransferase 1